MGGRARCSAWSWALGLMLSWRCTGIVLPPSVEHPAVGCHLSCSSGKWFSRTQHMCQTGSLFLEDVRITARVTTRGVDGTVLSDTFVTSGGDFATVDTICLPCSTVMMQRTQAREPERRGLHPGERDPLHPEWP